jgi:hypothetical protein
VANTVCKVLLVFPVSFACFTTPYAANCQSSSATNAAPPALQPFSAEFKITFYRTLANGTTITRESKEIQARDSNFRTFRQTTSSFGAGNQSENSTASVHDPVEGTNTTWQSRTHQAMIQKLPPREQRQGCWRNDTGTWSANFGPQPQLQKAPVVESPLQQTTEDLGTTMIEGIEARGRRTTHTIPVAAVGNDHPLAVTNEFWTAPSLGIVLRSVTDDPRGGRTTRELVHLDLGEPNPAIFEPPSDYQVQTQEIHQVPCDQLPH